MKSIISGSRLAASALAIALSMGVVTAEAGILKASPAPVSKFIENPQQLKSDRQRAPFHKYWRNPDPKAWKRVNGFNRIAIAPVNTEYLRARNDIFARSWNKKERRPVGEMAAYMRNRFQKQFAKSGAYQVVSRPGDDTLVLEMALVELGPTNVAGNAVRTGAQVFVPGAGFLGSQFTRGKIAVEGKLRNAETGEVLMQFTDRAHDKTSLISFRDFSPYAHDRRAINEWAKQVDELSRTPRNHRVRGSSGLTLNPF
jgi:hypothetical protein